MSPYTPFAPDRAYVNQIFIAVDTDRSGSICDAELQRALSSGTHKAFNIETCRLLIGLFDINGNKKVDFNEFYSLYSYVADWCKCFASYDRDGSGGIDKKELKTALITFGYTLPDKFFDMVMKQFSRTKTPVRSLTFDDFIQLCIMLQMITGDFMRKDPAHAGLIHIEYEDFLEMVVPRLIRR